MAYHELVKNFNKIREYMREFYVYGFRSREQFTKKSARSYDDARRRIESWLGDHMRFRQTADGKNVFLSIDSRVARHNPLYQAWKTKSFTTVGIKKFSDKHCKTGTAGYHYWILIVVNCVDYLCIHKNCHFRC